MRVTLLSSPTCMPCKMLDNKIKEIVTDHPEIEYNKIDATADPEKYNISSTPHVIIQDDEGNEIYNQHPKNLVDVINLIKNRLQ